MVNHIFHAEGTLRHQLYFPIILIILGWPSLALFYWSVCFLLFLDEFKSDFVDYDEFMEDCLEMFEVDLDHHLEMANAWHTLVSDHYSQPGRSFPADMTAQQSAYDRHADFDGGRRMNMWDHPEIYPIWFLTEWLQEEWEFLAETEIEPTCQLRMTDLESFYRFYRDDTKIDYAQNNNKHWLFERDYVWHPIITKAGANQSYSITRTPYDTWDLYSYLTASKTDDFRLNSWMGEPAAPAATRVKK